MIPLTHYLHDSFTYYINPPVVGRKLSNELVNSLTALVIHLPSLVNAALDPGIESLSFSVATTVAYH